MQNKRLVKIALSIIFTFVLTLVLVVVPSDVTSARLLSDKEPTSDAIECSPKILKNLEKFVEKMGKTADAYTTLGITYLSCNELKLAENRFNDAVEVAKKDTNRTAELIARYGLLEIDFLLGEITENEKKALTKEIADKIPNTEGFRAIWDFGEF